MTIQCTCLARVFRLGDARNRLGDERRAPEVEDHLVVKGEGKAEQRLMVKASVGAKARLRLKVLNAG